MNTSAPSPVALRDLAAQCAIDAGRLLEAALLEERTDVDTKSTGTDMVTEMDRESERFIVERILERRPHDAIVGEEGADRSGTSGIEWHVDPIDGTVNFVYDLPAWSTSVAAVDSDGAIAGAVYVPVTDELFSAARDAGATRNGEPIGVSDTTALSAALVATGFGYRPELRMRQAALLAPLLGQVRDVRRLGSAALDLCMVACGRVDAYYEEQLNSWDMAAGQLIAVEAGALATDFAGGAARPAELLVAAPGVHDALRSALNAVIGRKS